MPRPFFYSDSKMTTSFFRTSPLVISFIAAVLFPTSAAIAETPRGVIAKAIVTEESEEQVRLVAGLAGSTDPVVRQLLLELEGRTHLHLRDA